MTRSPEFYLGLKAEIENDPTQIGYANSDAPGQDEADANLLSEVRPTISVKRSWIATAEILNAIEPMEHQALTPQQARYVDSVLMLQQISPIAQERIIEAIRSMFQPGVTQSNAALAAAVVEQGSRLTQLYQAGSLGSDNPGKVTNTDVYHARHYVAS